MVIFKGFIKYIKITSLNLSERGKGYLHDLRTSAIPLRKFAGSLTCKYLLMSTNYSQKLNPGTQVHGTKTYLSTI